MVLALLLASVKAYSGKYDRPSSRPAAKVAEPALTVPAEILPDDPFAEDPSLSEPALHPLENEGGIQAQNAVPPPGEPIDTWFKAGVKEVSLSALKLILPSFIQITPESKLMGSLKWDIRSLWEASITADVTVSGIYVYHRGLADRAINLSGLHVRGTLDWDRSEKILTFSNVTVSRGGVTAYVNGSVNYQDKTAVRLDITVPDTPLQQALAALPADFIPKLQGAVVEGSVAVNAHFVADPSHPEEGLFEPGVSVRNYNLVQAPPAANIPALKADFTQEVKRNGSVVRTINLSRANPDFVPYENLGESTRQAILKAEDNGFFTHNGFNLGAIREAMARDLSVGHFARGGSTISMQLAKNLYLNGRRNLSRKLQEAMLTYAIEQEIDKKRILEIYANIIEWGDNVYGIAEASEHYFGKPPSLLDSSEAGLLASIIKSPVKKDFKRAQAFNP